MAAAEHGRRYTDGMPSITIMAGPNGAGKSTAAPGVIQDALAAGAFVNADVIARGLSGFDSESVAFQAGRIMLQRLDELLAQRADFAFETTLASRTFVPFIRRAREAGYHIHLVYVWLNSADLCIERVRERVHSGGHFVEDEIVRRRYERSMNNLFGLYQSLADDWRIYDNSVVGGSRIVAVGSGLTPTVIHERETWDEIRRRVGA
jgi:predicted ABC-type ATPase